MHILARDVASPGPGGPLRNNSLSPPKKYNNRTFTKVPVVVVCSAKLISYSLLFLK